MPSYIEFSPQASFPSASTAGNVILGITPSGQITTTNSNGVTTGITSSFAVTSSYALTAQTLLGSVQSASFASTASFVSTASFASTAGVANRISTTNIGGAGLLYPLLASSFTGNVNVYTVQSPDYKYDLTNNQLVVSSISSSFTGSFALPVSAYSWTSGYFNLSNNVDNIVQFNSQDINNNSGVFELTNSGTSTARIFLKQPGIYEFVSQIHLYDLYGNIDVYVKLLSGSSSGGAMGLVSLFNDEKIDEGGSDRTITGTIMINVTTPQYYSVAINPSANTPFPSSEFNTPTRLFIKKLA